MWKEQSNVEISVKCNIEDINSMEKEQKSLTKKKNYIEWENAKSV